MTNNTASANKSVISLDNNQIHIWRIDTNSPNIEIGDLYENVLSSDERERALRLRSENDKNRFIITRAELRNSLSKYLKVRPADIDFTYNQYGKPSIKSEHNPANIKFNVTHSNTLVLYAITQNREVGIDLEYVREVSNSERIVKRYFSEEDGKFYHSQSEGNKKLAFFKLWTRKEAYSKARGMGIGLPGKKFDLSLTPKFQNNSTENTNPEWSLVDIEINSDYMASLAAEGKDLEIYHFTVDTEI